MGQNTTNRADGSAIFSAIRNSLVSKSLGVFLAGSIVLSVICEVAGFNTMAAIIIAFAIVISIVTVLFVAIPVSALSLLD